MKNKYKINVKSKSMKLIFFCIFYLFIFYFLIFKNILLLFEINENITQGDIREKTLNYEKEKLLQAFEMKKQRLYSLMTINNNNEEKLSFDNMYSFFKYVDKKISENNIIFRKIGRSKKENDKITFSLEFSGSEKNIKNFFKIIENDVYDISFTNSYFTIFSENNFLTVEVYIEATVENKIKYSKTKIDEKRNAIFILHTDIEDREKNNISCMRIGSKEFYRENIKEKNINFNKEKSNKKKEQKK